MRTSILAGLFLFRLPLGAQTIVGAGYPNPAPVYLAPGELITFYVSDLTTTQGITSALEENVPVPAPVLAVSQVSSCPNVYQNVQSGCGSMSAVTVQIPYELNPDCGTCSCTACAGTTLVIMGNGKAGPQFGFIAVRDRVHILTICDTLLGVPPIELPEDTTDLPCAPYVTHGNGVLVSNVRPALPGEELIAWAVGLGQTSPAATTGQPAQAAPAAEAFYLDFNYRVNALPTKPYTGDPNAMPPQPVYAGSAPGYVGLYQVNFVVPPAPSNGITQCPPGGVTDSQAVSNFTVSIGGHSSFDGAGICVETPTSTGLVSTPSALNERRVGR
jgi:uncharacterized protein (TIGR03437 family)